MTDLERFVSKCTDVLPNGCIEWIGAADRNGYGAFKLHGRKIGAHRAALILSSIEIQSGADVCHTCDNRKCVNVKHLFVGTRSDNMKDATNKGRLPLLKMKYNKSKLDQIPLAEVIETYQKAGSVRKAAILLRVSQRNLSKRLKSIN